MSGDFPFIEKHDQFMQMLGICITRWSSVEEQLFKVCRDILGTTTEHTAIIYYRTPTIDSRLNLVNELIETVFPPPDSGQHRHKDYDVWSALYKAIKNELPIRNQLAHSPVDPVIDEPKDSKPRSIRYMSYIHPNEQARGKSAKEPLEIGSLKGHQSIVYAIVKRLRVFRTQKLTRHIAERFPHNIGLLSGKD